MVLNMHEFAGLALVHFLAVVAPGPDFAVTVRQSLRFGRQLGMAVALGIGAGISLHVGYTLLGVGALLQLHPWLVKVAAGIGALYLMYLGVGLLKSQVRGPDAMQPDHASPTTATPSWRQAFSLGFLTNALNPKATLFFLAIFTTMVSSQTPLAVQGMYGLWMCMVNATWFMLVAVLFTTPKVRTGFLRMGHWLERLMGVILLLFAARLVWQLV